MKAQLKFICNKEIISGEFNPAMTVLDFLRNMKEMKGTKEDAEKGTAVHAQCWLVNCRVIMLTIKYKFLPAAMGDIDGKHVISIEGLNIEGVNLFSSSLLMKAEHSAASAHRGLLYRSLRTCLQRKLLKRKRQSTILRVTFADARDIPESSERRRT